MRRSTRVLYVTSQWSGKPASASEVRAVQIASALRDVGHVEVALVGDCRAQPTVASADTETLSIRHAFDTEQRPNSTWLRRAQWLLDPRSGYRHGVAAIPSDDRRLTSLAEHYDLVWFFKLRTANMFAQWRWRRSVVDIDDVPSTFERSVCRNSVRLRDKSGALARAWSWRRHERLLHDRFNVATVCSDDDRSYLSQLGMAAPIHVLPNGFVRPHIEPTRSPRLPPRLGFIGVFDHAPNVLGVQWFVEHCWPAVKRSLPDVRLRLVGRLTDGPLRPSGPDIDALGHLDDPTDEMRTWAAMVVPLHVGAGTRGKIAHAFSLKCPVVSTPLGAFGYRGRHGFDMFLAKSADAFVDACVFTVLQPQAAANVAERAWRSFLDCWTWDAIRPRVWAAADECLRAEASRRGFRF